MMATWELHQEENIYFSFIFGNYVKIIQPPVENHFCQSNQDVMEAEAFVAVKTDVPKTFQEALQHPVWGAPSRSE